MFLSLSLPPSLPCSFSLLLSIPVRCGPHARESRARYTHMAGRPLLLAECAVLPPLQGTVSRGPQAAVARSAQHELCSLVSRAHDTSQRRTERLDRQIALSLPGSACGAFSLPLFLSPILSLPFLSLLRTLSLRYCLLSFTLPVPLSSALACARAIHHASGSCHPRDVSTTRRLRGPRASPSVVCSRAAACHRRARGPRTRRPGLLGYFLWYRGRGIRKGELPVIHRGERIRKVRS